MRCKGRFHVRGGTRSKELATAGRLSTCSQYVFFHSSHGRIKSRFTDRSSADLRRHPVPLRLRKLLREEADVLVCLFYYLLGDSIEQALGRFSMPPSTGNAQFSSLSGAEAIKRFRSSSLCVSFLRRASRSWTYSKLFGSRMNQKDRMIARKICLELATPFLNVRNGATVTLPDYGNTLLGSRMTG